MASQCRAAQVGMLDIYFVVEQRFADGGTCRPIFRHVFVGYSGWGRIFDDGHGVEL
jgi:hypothetical protein